MIDILSFIQVIAQCAVLCIISVAVRMFFPPEKVTARRVVQLMITSLFIAVVIAYYSQEKKWGQNQTVIFIMIGALLADELINTLFKSGLKSIKGRLKW